MPCFGGGLSFLGFFLNRHMREKADMNRMRVVLSCALRRQGLGKARINKTGGPFQCTSTPNPLRGNQCYAQSAQSGDASAADLHSECAQKVSSRLLVNAYTV